MLRQFLLSIACRALVIVAAQRLDRNRYVKLVNMLLLFLFITAVHNGLLNSPVA